jgi:hypothetical protein
MTSAGRTYFDSIFMNENLVLMLFDETQTGIRAGKLKHLE